MLTINNPFYTRLGTNALLQYRKATSTREKPKLAGRWLTYRQKHISQISNVVLLKENF